MPRDWERRDDAEAYELGISTICPERDKKKLEKKTMKNLGIRFLRVVVEEFGNFIQVPYKGIIGETRWENEN
jgi:hypothetical protein